MGEVIGEVASDAKVPHLPAEEIREAIAQCDWPRATALLARHQHELVTALEGIDRATMSREPWLDLLLAQRALLAELRHARNEVTDALERLSADHRGARAWLRELA